MVWPVWCSPGAMPPSRMLCYPLQGAASSSLLAKPALLGIPWSSTCWLLAEVLTDGWMPFVSSSNPTLLQLAFALLIPCAGCGVAWMLSLNCCGQLHCDISSCTAQLLAKVGNAYSLSKSDGLCQ